MKRIVLIAAFFSILFVELLSAQVPRGARRVYIAVTPIDTVTVVEILPITVFPRRIDMRQYQRLIDNIKVVYPIAKEANSLLNQIEQQVLLLPTRQAQEAYVKEMENKLKKQYTPIIRRMTFSQGKVLIKLIDRETGHTSYDLVKDLRGGFSAFFWQSLARLFGANLKDTYDPYGEDILMEQLIMLYERGEL